MSTDPKKMLALIGMLAAGPIAAPDAFAQGAAYCRPEPGKPVATWSSPASDGHAPVTFNLICSRTDHAAAQDSYENPGAGRSRQGRAGPVASAARAPGER